MWLQRIYGRAKKRVNPCHLGGQAPRTENEMGIKGQIQPAADMPDTHRRTAHGKPHGAYKGMLSDKNKKPYVYFPPAMEQLIQRWSEETDGFNKHSRILCKDVNAIVPRRGLGHADDQNAPELVEQINSIKFDLAKLREIHVVEALTHRWPEGAAINHAGLVVHHEMEVFFNGPKHHGKPWISTFFLPFKEDSCKEDCCPTAAKWVDVVYKGDKQNSHKDLIKKWLVKGYTDDIGMRTELGANNILESGFVEHLVKNNINYIVQKWTDKQNPFGNEGVDDDTKRAEVNLIAEQISEVHEGHFLKYIDVNLHYREGDTTYKHNIRLHHGACDPAENTLVSYAVSVDVVLDQNFANKNVVQGVKKPIFLHNSAETFKQYRSRREEAVVTSKVVAQIGKDGLKKTLLDQIPNWEILCMPHTLDQTEWKQHNDDNRSQSDQSADGDDDHPPPEEGDPFEQADGDMYDTLSTYFIPRKGKKFSDTFSVMLVHLKQQNKMYAVFSQLIPPVKQRMTYHFDTGHKYKEGHYINLVDEHGKHLIYDPVITEFYQKQDQKRADVFYRDQHGLPYTVQIKVVDSARHPTVRMCEWLAGIERKVPKLLSDLKKPRAYTDLKNGEDLANRERQHANCYHKVYHVKQQGFRTRYYPGAAQQHKPGGTAWTSGNTTKFKSEFTLLPPNPRRALQLGSQVHPDPGNHTMSTIVVDLA